LFTGYGPLASFAATIDIAYAPSIIDDNFVGDFRALKSIRNSFAHPQGQIHFQSAQLFQHFQKLKGFTKETDKHRRSLFDERLAACVDHIDQHKRPLLSSAP
jgi:DNA-binding MltR family transcriptional regulator